MTRIDEAQAHEDLVALLEAQRDSATVRELLRLQKLVDDGVLQSATATREVDVLYDVDEWSTTEEIQRAVTAGAKALAQGLPVDVTVVTLDGPSHWPLIRFEGKPGDVALVLARYGLED